MLLSRTAEGITVKMSRITSGPTCTTRSHNNDPSTARISIILIRKNPVVGTDCTACRTIPRISSTNPAYCCQGLSRPDRRGICYQTPPRTFGATARQNACVCRYSLTQLSAYFLSLPELYKRSNQVPFLVLAVTGDVYLPVPRISITFSVPIARPINACRHGSITVKCRNVYTICTMGDGISANALSRITPRLIMLKLSCRARGAICPTRDPSVRCHGAG